jgi:hypothetical protein
MSNPLWRGSGLLTPADKPAFGLAAAEAWVESDVPLVPLAGVAGVVLLALSGGVVSVGLPLAEAKAVLTGLSVAAESAVGVEAVVLLVADPAVVPVPLVPAVVVVVVLLVLLLVVVVTIDVVAGVPAVAPVAELEPTGVAALPLVVAVAELAAVAPVPVAVVPVAAAPVPELEVLPKTALVPVSIEPTTAVPAPEPV